MRHGGLDASIMGSSEPVDPRLNVLGPDADPGFWKGGGAWGVADKLAVRSSQVCNECEGVKACPLGTFEILDAFSCNLVHILSKNYI